LHGPPPAPFDNKRRGHRRPAPGTTGSPASASPETRRLIDFSRPLAILFVSVLHFISDADDPHGIVSRFIDAAAPGSYLVLSHVTTDPSPQTAAKVASVYATANEAAPRPHARILAFFDGLHLIEPGLLPVSQWRPDEPVQEDPGKGWILGGVGCKSS